MKPVSFSKSKTFLFIFLSIILNTAGFVFAFANLADDLLVFSTKFGLLSAIIIFNALELYLTKHIQADSPMRLFHSALSFPNVVLLLPFQLAQIIPFWSVHLLYLLYCLTLLLFTEKGRMEIKEIKLGRKKDMVWSIILLLILPEIIAFFLTFIVNPKKKSLAQL